MGILTHIATEYDHDNEEIIITAVTRGQISTRAALNRLTGRAAVGGIGSRTLLAASYDELGIDLVWNQGLGFTVPLEEKYPDAQKIEYFTFPIERASNFGDITGIDESRIPGTKLRDLIVEGIDSFRPEESHMHVWRVPFEVSEYKWS